MRNLAQRKCWWCRKWFYDCKITGCLSDECKDELREYAASNGRTWRAKLRAAWTAGSDELRELRNTVGPSDLAGVKPVQKWRGDLDKTNRRGIFE